MSREINTNYLVIALPSGRLFKPSIRLFEEVGIDLKGGEGINRKLAFFDQEEEVKFVITRPKDNPTYIECGVADIGIVGELSLIHISEPTRLGMISYAVFCLKKKKKKKNKYNHT